ncbi:hypothetical protein IC575_004669 [Cucumis melo]
MDVKNAFLNGTLSEEVYMKPPSGITPPPQKVCLIRCALYDLKQAPRTWFATFSSTITQLGFTSTSHESTLFTRQTSNGIVLLLLYVDDMIFTGDDPQAISDLQCYLGKHFEMKDLGNLNYFLGLETSLSPNGYYLSQAKYTSNLLSRSGITDSATFSTPLDPNVCLTPFNGVPLDDSTLYWQLVGNLIYLIVTQMSNITFLYGNGTSICFQRRRSYDVKWWRRIADLVEETVMADTCVRLGEGGRLLVNSVLQILWRRTSNITDCE